MSERVLITGASGLLGRALVRRFTDRHWVVVGLCFSRQKPGLIKVDLNDEKDVERAIDQFQPTVVVHAAAQRFPDKFDTELESSFKLNVNCAEMLAKLCRSKNIWLIHISTDYVFDGTTPPYKETDPVCPINLYGKSKADAEAAVIGVNSEAAILRVPVLYGEEEYIGESAVSALLKTLKDTSKEQMVSSYEVRCPATTDDVAFVCERLARVKVQEPQKVTGIYQWWGSESMTKCDMIKSMAEVFELRTGHLKNNPNPGSGAPRPQNSQMSRDRVENLGISTDSNFKEQIRKYYSKFL